MLEDPLVAAVTGEEGGETEVTADSQKPSLEAVISMRTRIENLLNLTVRASHVW